MTSAGAANRYRAIVAEKVVIDLGDRFGTSCACWTEPSLAGPGTSAPGFRPVQSRIDDGNLLVTTPLPDFCGGGVLAKGPPTARGATRAIRQLAKTLQNSSYRVPSPPFHVSSGRGGDCS